MNFCYGGRKSFVTWQISAVATGARGLYAPFWLTKNTFLEHHVRGQENRQRCKKE